MLISFIGIEFHDEVTDDDWATAENIKDLLMSLSLLQRSLKRRL